MNLKRLLKFLFERLRVHWKRFANSPLGKRLLKGLRRAITVGVVGYLIYRLGTIGWGEVWTLVPETPWFYVLFVGIYAVLPVFQTLIFSIVWGRPLHILFPPMLKKRVYNKDVLSYSGEVYLYLWGDKRISGWSGRELMHSIKDNAIVSSVASTAVALGLLGIFFLSGIVVLPEFVVEHGIAYTVGGAFVAALIVYAGVKFHRVALKLSGRLLATLFGLHVCRLLLVQALQILQWKVVIPKIELSVWFTFLAVQIIMQGIPLLPSRDLLFVTAGIEMAGALEISRAAIAGLFVVQSVLDKCTNLIAFVVVSLWDRRTLDRFPGLDGEEEELNEGVTSLESINRAEPSVTGGMEPRKEASTTE